MNLFRLLVLTPSETFYDGEIGSLVIPTEDGEMGFLAGREATVREMVPGCFRFRDGAGKECVAESDGGVFEMTGKRATLLCGAVYLKEEAAAKKGEREAYLEEERRRQERSLAEYKMTRAALMRAFDKLKRTSGKM